MTQEEYHQWLTVLLKIFSKLLWRHIQRPGREGMLRQLNLSGRHILLPDTGQHCKKQSYLNNESLIAAWKMTVMILS